MQSYILRRKTVYISYLCASVLCIQWKINLNLNKQNISSESQSDDKYTIISMSTVNWVLTCGHANNSRFLLLQSQPAPNEARPQNSIHQIHWLLWWDTLTERLLSLNFVVETKTLTMIFNLTTRRQYLMAGIFYLRLQLVPRHLYHYPFSQGLSLKQPCLFVMDLWSPVNQPNLSSWNKQICIWQCGKKKTQVNAMHKMKRKFHRNFNKQAC